MVGGLLTSSASLIAILTLFNPGGQPIKFGCGQQAAISLLIIKVATLPWSKLSHDVI
jgi:hypothetical protein